MGTGQTLPQRLALALLLAGCATPRPAAAPPPTANDPEIAALVRAVDPARVQADIEKLASFHTRNSCSGDKGILAAEAWLREQFSSLGLKVVAVPYTACEAERHSVLAILPGRDPRRVVLVGGHYDSRSTGRTDGEARSPGANDSGSQTAVVLEVARTLARRPLEATLAFVAFGGEEQGLLGSSSLAENLGTYFPGARLEAVLNCDIVGGDRDANPGELARKVRLFAPGTPRELKGPDGSTDDTSPSRNLQRAVVAIGARYLPELIIAPQFREDRPGRGGDHEPFIAKGFAGVRFIEAAETLAHQHSPDDTPENLTPGYAGQVARLVVAAAASLARAPAAPRWEDVGANPHIALVGRRAGELGYSIRSRILTDPAKLGLPPPYWVSAVAVDQQGHESLPAYPELRCDGTACTVPADALDTTAKN